MDNLLAKIRKYSINRDAIDALKIGDTYKLVCCYLDDSNHWTKDNPSFIVGKTYTVSSAISNNSQPVYRLEAEGSFYEVSIDAIINSSCQHDNWVRFIPLDAITDEELFTIKLSGNMECLNIT